jgi:hypothetical protein
MLHIPFDQYQRYQIIREAVTAYCGGDGKGYSLLEVGGYPGVIQDFLPRVRTVVLDQIRQPLKNYIIGDGVVLPFKDQSFDFVISVDVLEHIAPERREAFLRELRRVSRKMIGLIFPCYSREAAWAENQLAAYFKEKLGLTSEFLNEHMVFGLPRSEEVTRIAEKLDLTCLAYPNSYLPRWLVMMAATYTLDYFYPYAEQLSKGMHLVYNTCFYPRDNREPAYRKLFLLFPDGGEPMSRFEEAFARNRPPAGGGLDDLDLDGILSPLYGFLQARSASVPMRDIPYGPFQVVKDTLQKNLKVKADLESELEKIAEWARDMERSLKIKIAETEELKHETSGLRDEKERLEKEAAGFRQIIEKERSAWEKGRKEHAADRAYASCFEHIIDRKASMADILRLEKEKVLTPEQTARLKFEYHRNRRFKRFYYFREYLTRRRGYFAKNIEGFLIRDAVVFKSNTYYHLEPVLNFLKTYFPECRLTIFSHESDLEALPESDDIQLITYANREEALKKLRSIKKKRFDLAAVMTGGERVFKRLQRAAFFCGARYILIFSRRGSVFWWNGSHKMSFYRECKLWYAEKIGLRQDLKISELIISTLIRLLQIVYLCAGTLPYFWRKQLARNVRGKSHGR